jgi:hypothetical protein
MYRRDGLGPGGRRFESCLPDHLLSENSALSGLAQSRLRIVSEQTGYERKATIL